MTHNIKTIRGRAALPPASKPYWETLTPGIKLGLYVGKRGQSWQIRVDNPGAGSRYIERKLGPVEPAPDGLDFTTAQRRALEAGEDIRTKAVTDRVHASHTATTTATVSDACAAWVQHKNRQSGNRASEKTVVGWRHTAGRVVGYFGAQTPLDEITGQRVAAFGHRPLERRRNGSDQRAPDGVNSEISDAQAIFNYRANQNDYRGRTRWNEAEKIDQNEVSLQKADDDADIYAGPALTVEQVRGLILAIDDPVIADFVELMFLTCQRPQALRMCDVRDFQPNDRTLRLRFGKNARKRGALHIPLYGAAWAHLETLCAGRAERAPLFVGQDGKRLAQDFQRYAIPRAVKVAGLPEGTTLYSVRHAALTHALTVERTDALTVALMGDVDPKVIMRHYLKQTVDLPEGPSLKSVDVVRLRASS